MTHFEKLIQQAQADCVAAMMKAELGNSHLHAFLKGQHGGLTVALQIFKKAMRLDAEE